MALLLAAIGYAVAGNAHVWVADRLWLPPQANGPAHDWLAHVEDDFRKAYKLARNFSFVCTANAALTYQAMRLLNARGVQGDVLEAGVYKGGMSMLMALGELRERELRSRGAARAADAVGAQRTFWLYDTFEGLPPPRKGVDDERSLIVYDAVQAYQNGTATAAQRAIVHARVKGGAIARNSEGDDSGEGDQYKHARVQQLDELVASVDVIAPLAWDYGAQDLVEANMRSTGIDDAHLRFVKGRVEQTLRSGLATGDLPAKIAFLRLDTDFLRLDEGGARGPLAEVSPRRLADRR